MKKYYIKTFGCAMNIADSEKINMIFSDLGFVEVLDWKKADIVIFNTCSVRKKGEDRVFGMFKEISKQENDIVVGIVGCMVKKTGLNSKYLNKKNSRKPAKTIKLAKEEKEIFNNDDKLFPKIKNLDFTLRIEDIKYLDKILSKIFESPSPTLPFQEREQNRKKEYKNNFKFCKIEKFYKFLFSKKIINPSPSFVGYSAFPKREKFCKFFCEAVIFFFSKKKKSAENYLEQEQLRKNSFQINVVIQTGCDNYCSFCVVPYTRGREISRKKEKILEEIKKAVNLGAKEVCLIGQNVNSYGKLFSGNNYFQQKSQFRELLEEVDKFGLDRIRFLSSNPHDMTKDILDAHFDLKSTCNYIHFALQSGSDEMLKKMNRKHTYNDFKKHLDYLRNRDPLFGISTDIIVGFSGETEKMFKETIKAIEECEFDFVYNSKYSARPGTLASKLYEDDISDKLKTKRWRILNDLLLKNIKKRSKLMIGREEVVLVEGEKNNQFFGRTRNFKEVFFDRIDGVSTGDLVKVKIISLDKFVLKGEVL